MVKPIKIMLGSIVALILILLIIVCTLLFVIDVNNFKSEICAIVKNKTGRDLLLNDSLKLTLFPDLSLRTGVVVLGNPVNFQGSFISAESISIRLKTLPLLSQKIVSDIIEIQGLTVKLITNKHGVNNWNMASDSIVDQQGANNMALLMATSKGIILKNARVNWKNEQTGQDIGVKNINLNTHSIALNKPVDSLFSLSILDQKSQLELSVNGESTITLNNSVNALTATHNALQLTLIDRHNFEKPVTFTATNNNITFNYADKTAQINELHVKAENIILAARGAEKKRNKPVMLVLDSKSIAINADQQIIVFNDLDLKTTDIGLPMGIANNFTKKSVALALNSKSLEINKNKQTLTFNKPHINTTAMQVSLPLDNGLTNSQSPSRSFIFNLNSQDIVLDNINKIFMANDLQLSLMNVLIKSNIKFEFTKARPIVTGTLEIMPFNPHELMTQLAIPLPPRQDNKTLSQLKADFLFRATSETITLNHINAFIDDSALTGSMNIWQFSKPNPHITFNVVIDAINADRYLPPSSKMVTPETKSPAFLAAIPLATLRKLNMSGTLRVHRLDLNQLTMRDIHLALDDAQSPKAKRNH